MRGCLAVLILIVVLFIGGCSAIVAATDDSDDWCRDTEQFWADGNQRDSGPLADEYAFQCS